MINKLEQTNSGEDQYDIKSDEIISEFFEKHKSIDLRKWIEQTNSKKSTSFVSIEIGKFLDILLIEDIKSDIYSRSCILIFSEF